MSEMVERVKDAIMSSARDCGVSFSGGEVVARAAIEAMRKPTPELLGIFQKLEPLTIGGSIMEYWEKIIDGLIDDTVAK